MSPVIHFAHANGIPSACYQKLFSALSDQFRVCSVAALGTEPLYPIDDQWRLLTQQVIDSIEAQSAGQKVVAVGHSLGALLSFQAARLRPDLIQQVIMLDPPLMLGLKSLALHVSKKFGHHLIDRMTPAQVSARRRDHWPSREDAAQRLLQRKFFQEWDADCFADYIRFGLQDHATGGVSLSIPKASEVAIFRSMPSLWWLPFIQTASMPVDMLIGRDSPFIKHIDRQKLRKKLAIEYHLSQGGHMFPLQYPQQTAAQIKALIAAA